MIRNCNDGSNRAPYLRCDINGGNVWGLPPESSVPRGDDRAVHEGIKAAGFEGIQGGNVKLCRELGLGITGGGRVDKKGDADELARKTAGEGLDCATLHAGIGIEDDATIDWMLDEICAASEKHNVPLFLETHRATITQDMWRTVEMTRRCPQIRFNGDFSHWYTGLEMPYGGVEKKYAFMAPVFDRVRFVHGRIGNSGSMQVDIGDGTAKFVGHFREMWTLSFVGFLRHANPGDFLCFTPELLGPGAYYARLFPNKDGVLLEETDRWQQAIAYVKIARECWAEAQKRLGKA